ncbi:MAG: 2'-5' RNA ligase family protein [Candidatus Hermodarchaeota archaeon]
MPVAIILGFDAESTKVLNRVHRKLKESKFNSYYELVIPHITLKSYDYIDLQVAKERLQQFCDDIDSFRIQFSSFAYFPSEEGVVFLNPKTTVELLEIQQRISELFEDFQAGNSPSEWIPHSTLATDVPLNKIGEAIEIVKEDIKMEMEAPFYAEAQSIWTVEFKTGPISIISTDEFKFKGAV